jgi:hypothetical protein
MALIQSDFSGMIHPALVKENSNATVEPSSHKLQSKTQQKVILKWTIPKPKLCSFNNSVVSHVN